MIIIIITIIIIIIIIIFIIYVFIDRTYHIVSWRFTILLLGEIARQLVKASLAIAISPY